MHACQHSRQENYPSLRSQRIELVKDLIMKKLELVSAIADYAEMTKTDAAKALEAFIAVVTKALKKDDSVTIVGFGTYEVRKRKARTGRNPKTGAALKIKASKVPAFKAGKALKDAVN
jgi:DNA-binding protein HU-beta